MKYIVLIIYLISFNIFTEENHNHHHDDHNEHNDKDQIKAKSHKAHEHGLSILNIVQDKDAISFEFEMPGFDVVGFEYKAKKKEDIKKVKKALNILSEYENMVTLPNSGSCNQEKSSARVFYEGTHSEFVSEYKFICSNISKVESININFFDSFKYSKKLNINLVSKNKKISEIFEKSNNILSVKGYFN